MNSARSLKEGFKLGTLRSANVWVDGVADLLGVLENLVTIVEIHIDRAQNIIDTEGEDALIQLLEFLPLLARNICRILKVVRAHDSLEIIGALGINNMLLVTLDPYTVADLVLKILDVGLREECLVHGGCCVNTNSRLLLKR